MDVSPYNSPLFTSTSRPVYGSIEYSTSSDLRHVGKSYRRRDMKCLNNLRRIRTHARTHAHINVHAHTCICARVHPPHPTRTHARTHTHTYTHPQGQMGVESVGGDGSETGLVTKKKGEQKSTAGIGASSTWTAGKRRTTYNNVCRRPDYVVV